MAQTTMSMKKQAVPKTEDEEFEILKDERGRLYLSQKGGKLKKKGED